MNSILILNKIDDLQKIKFPKKRIIILNRFDLNSHYKFAKEKINYLNYCNFYEILQKNKINKIYLEYKNISQYLINDLFRYKKKIFNINLIFHKKDFISYSKNFKTVEKAGINYLHWNFGNEKKSYLKIFNYLPQLLKIEFNINWPPFNEWQKLFNINKLSDNFNNKCFLGENNKKFTYFIKPFQNKKIIFKYRKFFSYKNDPRNLNFALKNCKILFLKHKLSNKNKFIKKLTFIKNFKVNKIQFFSNKIKQNNNFDFCIMKLQK